MPRSEQITDFVPHMSHLFMSNNLIQGPCGEYTSFKVCQRAGATRGDVVNWNNTEQGFYCTGQMQAQTYLVSQKSFIIFFYRCS